MSERKYKKGDKVYMSHDNYPYIPRGTEGIVTFVGIIKNGRPSYHVKFVTMTTPIIVIESELVHTP